MRVVVRVVVVRGVVEYTARDAPASRAGHPHAGIARIDRSIDRSIGRSVAREDIFVSDVRTFGRPFAPTPTYGTRGRRRVARRRANDDARSTSARHAKSRRCVVDRASANARDTHSG